MLGSNFVGTNIFWWSKYFGDKFDWGGLFCILHLTSCIFPLKESGFCAEPMKQDLTLFSLRNNNHNIYSHKICSFTLWRRSFLSHIFCNYVKINFLSVFFFLGSFFLSNIFLNCHAAMQNLVLIFNFFFCFRFLEKLRSCDHTAVAFAILYKMFRKCEND